MVVMVSIMVAVMVATVPVMVPAVVVFTSAVIAVPVACIVPLPIVTRCYPTSPFVWRSGPVLLMPFVVVSDWIPIAFHKRKFGRWSWR